jgi:hypothetical protein
MCEVAVMGGLKLVAEASGGEVASAARAASFARDG